MRSFGIYLGTEERRRETAVVKEKGFRFGSVIATWTKFVDRKKLTTYRVDFFF